MLRFTGINYPKLALFVNVYSKSKQLLQHDVPHRATINPSLPHDIKKNLLLTTQDRGGRDTLHTRARDQRKNTKTGLVTQNQVKYLNEKKNLFRSSEYCTRLNSWYWPGWTLGLPKMINRKYPRNPVVLFYGGPLSCHIEILERWCRVWGPDFFFRVSAPGQIWLIPLETQFCWEWFEVFFSC